MRPEVATVAIVQQPPAVLDKEESIRRAVAHVVDAAVRGAKLVVFPETWLTGYPAWVFGMAGWDDPVARKWYGALIEQSVVVDPEGDDDLAQLREAAAEHEVTIVIGVNERAGKGGGSVYNSLVTISSVGGIANVHRKLTPTHTERIVWANGDANGLVVLDTPVGRVGGLVCWEHFHPLARQALHAQNEQIHVAAWPDMPAMHHVASQMHAFEGRCFVLVAGQFLRAGDVPEELLAAYRSGVGVGVEAGDVLFSGGSGIVSPDGSWLVEPVFGEATTIIAELPLTDVDAFRHDLDVAGHYSRPDVFELRVTRQRRSTLTVLDEPA